MRTTVVKALAVVLCASAICSGAGVYATWEYVHDLPSDGVTTEIAMSAGEWIYLPGAEGNDTVEVGENHSSLIDAILNHAKQGLNFSDFLTKGMDKNGNDLLYSQQNNVAGGTPKKFFGTDEYNTQYLDFVMQRITDAEVESYYVYTFEDDDLVGTVGSSYVPCYQVLLKAVGTQNGRTQYAEAGIKQGRAPLDKPSGFNFYTVHPSYWEQT